MIKLERVHSWYRPYGVVAGGKEYVLDGIRFYDENGVVVSAGGWLQDVSGKDVPTVILPVDKVIRRNKEKFDGEVFGCVTRDLGESKLILHIPTKMVNLKYEGKKKLYGDRVYECYVGDFGMYLTKYVESLDSDLRAIRDKYDGLLSSIGAYDVQKNPDEVINKLGQMIELVSAYKEERTRIDNIVVED
jgi:hypothetical protein